MIVEKVDLSSCHCFNAKRVDKVDLSFFHFFTGRLLIPSYSLFLPIHIAIGVVFVREIFLAQEDEASFFLLVLLFCLFFCFSACLGLFFLPLVVSLF